MPDEKGIYAALAAVNRKLGTIAKTQKNEYQNYMFRGIDDVMNALGPLLDEEEILVVREDMDLQLDRPAGSKKLLATLKTKWTLTAVDGSGLAVVAFGQGEDTQDKAVNKAASASFKYGVCLQLFCVPTADMEDADKGMPEIVDTPTRATEAQKETIRTLVEETGKDLTRLCEYYGGQSLGHLSGVDADDAIAVMRRLASTKKAVDNSVTNSKSGG